MNEEDKSWVKKEYIVRPTNFLLAVQETNFIYSFALSGFVAATVVCTILLEGNLIDGENVQETWFILLISTLYTLFGLVTSITIYGRKTDHLE